MAVANNPMIEGAKKYGYTYVDTDGTTYVDSHPDAAGHVFIANKIIEALPNKEISQKYTDIAGNKYYNAIEYVLLNGIMAPESETTFNPDAPIKSYELVNALNAIKGTETASDNTKSVTVIRFAFDVLGCSATKGFVGFFKGIALGLSVISDNNFNITGTVSRGAAANYLMTLNEI